MFISFTVICTGICQNCDIEVFPNFYTQNNQKYVTPESIDNDRFIYFNGNQIFERNLLIDFDQKSTQSQKERENRQTDFSATSACSS